MEEGLQDGVTLHGGSPTYSTALKKVPHVGQISNKFKIEQALLREGVPTDAGFCYQKSIYISLQP